jgi:nucleoside-diphosphate-sugar epimerase
MYSIGIVGNNGYIGSYIYDTLLKDSYNVIALDYRYKDIDTDILSKLDVIIYTGGISTRILCSELSRDELISKNIDDIIKLSCALNKSQLLLYLSTAALYEGTGNSLPNEFSQIERENLDIYSQSMYDREILISKLTNCNTVGLRIGMVSGFSRRQRYDLAFMNRIYTSLHENVIYVDQHNPSRAILGLCDLYRCVEVLIQHRLSIRGHHIYNISSFNTTINDLTKYISSELQSSIKVIPNNRNNNILGFSMDTTSFCTSFNFTFKETKETLLSMFLEHKDMFYIFTTRCRVCKKNGLELILDLGNQPLVNNLLLSSDNDSECFPLNIYECKQCHHTQLGCTVPPLKMFNFYTYVSGVSSSAIAHFKMITEYLISFTKGRKSVLEIASNDGCQLDFFKLAGFQTFGIDPAKNICDIANKKGHTIICDYWGDKDFSILPKEFDIILAQNVLAHVPDPVAFVKKCVEYMTDDTILYLQTSQCDMYLHNEFDTIYHEHMSFFTLESFKYLAEKCNLTITNMKKFAIHGTSYGLSFKKGNGEHCSEFMQYLMNDRSLELYSSSFYYKYRSNIIKFKYDILNILEEYKKNYTIVGYGAAAKGITMLNYINFKNIDYIVDDSELKYGKFTPGLKIPIVSKEILQNDTRNLLIIILPWNIKEELIQKIQILVQGRSIRMLISFPKICII